MSEFGPLLGAHVSGWSAFVLDTILRRHAPAYLAAMTSAQREQVVRVHTALHRAALYWQQEQESTSADGNAEVVGAEASASSGCAEVAVSEIAAVLGVTERRARQLAESWAEQGLARKVGRAWLVDAAAVQQRRADRRSA